MKVFRHIFHTLILGATACSAWGGNAFWQGTLQDEKKGSVVIRLSDVTAVAIHTYMLNGTIEITECTVDMRGNHSFRFYAMAEKDDSTQAKVVKTALGTTKKVVGNETSFPSRKFPEGAYSHNIEYQLKTPEKVYKLYKSIRDEWYDLHSTTTFKHMDQ